MTWIFYTPNQDEKRIPLKAGSDCFIPRATPLWRGSYGWNLHH